MTKHVVESATSPPGNGQCVYAVWVMTSLKCSRRTASVATLQEAFKAITPEERKEYVYILKWTPARQSPAKTTPFGPDGRFRHLQGQPGTSRPAPTCEYIWGCICNRVHTNDLRESVRKVLRSN